MTDKTTDIRESQDSVEARVDLPAGPAAEDSAGPGAGDSAGPGAGDSAESSPRRGRAWWQPRRARAGSSDDSEPVEEAPVEPKSLRQRRSISVSVRSLVIAAVVTILVGAVGTLAWLYIDAQNRLDAQARRSADNARAEKIALDYAVNAATMDFKDLQAWKVKLVAGTSQELNAKLSEAATSMEQILVPLEWSSTAAPLVAKVRSKNEDSIIVDCFVSVQTKTVQAPQPLQSTATYGITIDSNHNWLITDVGGIGSVVTPK